MQEVKWYFKLWAIIIAILLLGPFALPLVWKSPAIKKGLKIVLTILTIALTVWLVAASADLFRLVLKDLQELQKL